MSDPSNPVASVSGIEPSDRPREPLTDLIQRGAEQEVAAHLVQLPGKDAVLAVTRRDAAVNILLNILAASVIAAHQDNLAAVIALAVLLPIIALASTLLPKLTG